MWQKFSDNQPAFTFKCEALSRHETDRFLMRYPGTGNRVCIAQLYRYIGDGEIFCQTNGGVMQDYWDKMEWCAIPE